MGTTEARISALLKEKDISQKDLAMMAGVSASVLSRCLSGERKFQLEVLSNIATALGTTLDYLVNGTAPENDFSEIYRLVARGASDMTTEEKIKLIEVLTRKR